MDELTQYYGTKRIAAKPMSRADYNTYRGWALPQDENGADEGYLVVYQDSNPNTEDYDGYVSWSPKAVFDAAYQPTDKMNFSHALQAVKEGHRLCREGWNGKDMFIFLVAGSQFEVNRAPLLGIFPEGTVIDYSPHIDIKQADGGISTWVASIGDLMAEDWRIVE